jgi:hypothetical protein
MAELADAADSKSAEVYPSWGFDPPSRHHSALKTILIDLTLARAAFARLLALGPNYDGWFLIPALRAHPPGRSPFPGDHFTATSVDSKKYLSRSFHEIFRLHNA